MKEQKPATNVPRVPCPPGYTHLLVRPDPVGSKLQRKGAQLQTAPQGMYQSWRLNTGEAVRNTRRPIKLKNPMCTFLPLCQSPLGVV